MCNLHFCLSASTGMVVEINGAINHLFFLMSVKVETLV